MIDLLSSTNAAQAKCISELRKECQEHPEFADVDGTSSVADGVSTSAISGTVTPMTPGHPKLKLTFNKGHAENTSVTNGGDSGAVSDDE